MKNFLNKFDLKFWKSRASMMPQWVKTLASKHDHLEAMLWESTGPNPDNCPLITARAPGLKPTHLRMRPTVHKPTHLRMCGGKHHEKSSVLRKSQKEVERKQLIHTLISTIWYLISWFLTHLTAMPCNQSYIQGRIWIDRHIGTTF